MSIFSSVAMRYPRKSKFDLSHEKKLSLQMGDLVPILVQEALPGDSFRANSEVFLRWQALISPVMHRVDVTTHYFFVPNRLIWSEWEDFITGGRTGLAAPIHPQLALTEGNKLRFGVGSLADYLGVPTVDPSTIISGDTFLSALPFRAYQLIYDEYYRDNQLTPPVDCPTTSGIQAGASVLDAHTTMRKRAWEKDYLTSARPSSQLGAEVNLPVTNTVNYASTSTIKTTAGATPAANTLLGSGTTGNSLFVNKTGAVSSGTAGRVENISSVDSQITINNVRRSLRIQEWLEKNMRAGSRYVEQILSHFGVKSSDARLQRPEYLGGGKQAITISEVLQQSEGTTTPLGTMGGHGYSVGSSNRFQRTFEEHGFIIGIMSVLPKTAYQQGIDRMFSRFDKFDYYWPEFQNIGEQEVLQKEVYWDAATPASNTLTWGYQQRYAEYKYQPSTVHGDFRTSLAYWHMGRIFNSAPPLNTAFVEADPTNRIFAVTDPNVDKCLVQVYNRVDALRPMSYFSIPSI